MNERIEQFAEQATEEMDPEAFSEDMNIPPEWYQKFAELIVRECAAYIFVLDAEPVSHKSAARMLMEHFGIKNEQTD